MRTRAGPVLEVAANSVATALAAQEGDLCAALELELELGGITRSHAQIAIARERPTIPLLVLIRPRGGDFLYSSELECAPMLRDGAGIDAQHIAARARAAGANEFHASAKRRLPSGTSQPRTGLADMATGEWRTDPAEVRPMAAALEELHT